MIKAYALATMLASTPATADINTQDAVKKSDNKNPIAQLATQQTTKGWKYCRSRIRI